MHDHIEGAGTRGQPLNFGLLGISDNQTFQVRGLPPRTHLDRIYLNGLHTLLPFWITNQTSSDLTVSLASTMGTAIKFHTQNPNWDAVPGGVREKYVRLEEEALGDETTMVCSAATQKDFNEVFNQLNGDETVRVGAHETAEVVMLFMAQTTQRLDVTPAHSRRPSLGQISNHSAPASNSFVDSISGQGAAALDASMAGSARQQFGFQSSSGTIVLQTVVEPGHGSTDMYTVDLRTSYCRSVLEMDPPTSRIYLDDCVIGRPYERMFRVRNASAIGLDWTMTAVEGTAQLTALQLLGSDLQQISGGHMAGHSSQQVLLRYTPESAGEFLCRFLIENANDPANQRYWVFRARVSQRQKPKRVELLSDPDINFGDCTSGVWYRREVVYKNVSDTLVVMRFRVEGNITSLTIKSSVKQAGETLTPEIGPDGLTWANSTTVLLDDDTSRTSMAADDEALTTATDDVNSNSYPRTPTAAIAHYSSTAADAAAAAAAAAADELISENGSFDATRNPTTMALAGNNGSVSSMSGVSRAADAGDSATQITTGKDPKSRRTHQPALLDDVVIKPGAVRRVEFAVRGSPGSSGAFNAGQFGRLSFTLFCEYSTTLAGTATATAAAHSGGKHTEASDRNIERLSIPCTVNMCTSLVRVTPALLDFGPVDVGTLKSLDLVIENQSAVAAAIQCQVDSKVITCNRAPLTVPALQSVRVRVDIYPRRVNARYRKQIVVRNLHNRRNDSVVEVRSEHVDRRRMAYHNLFYRTLVPDNEQNFVDFGTIPLNSRVLRRVNLHSRCPRPMTIQLAAGDDGGGVVSLYTTVDPRALASAEVRDAARRLPLLERQAEIHSSIERFKERAEVPQDTAGAAAVPRRRPTESLASSVLQRDMFVDKRVQRGHTCLVPFPRTMRAAHPSIDYLDIATRDPPIRPPMTVRIRRRRLHDGGIGHVSEPAHAEPPAVAETVARIMERAARILDEIVNGLDTTPCTLFATAKAEDEYVRRQVDLHKYVDLLIESGYLKPAQSVTLPASGSAPVFVMVRAMESLLEPHADPSSSSVPPRLDANVYMKLVERPVDLLDTAAELPEGMAQLPERRFLVRASFCRSDLGLGQKSINVGNMQVDESSRKYLLIQNRAETPLMYAIRKTGSIASGDIRFVDSNRYGVVRGFDSRKIVFVFRPSLTGAYNEQISIANVLNAHGGKTATLKAVVRRPSKFYIQSLALSFPSPLSVDQRSDEFQALVLKNMTPKTRILVVRPIDPPPSDTPISVLLAPVFPADIADAAAPPPRLLDRETEEKIEALEQKLKIAVRKNRPEKIDKYHKKLAKLRGSAHAPADAQDTLPDGASSPGTNDKAVVVARADGDSHLVVTLPASADVSIPVVAVPHILEDGVSGVVAAQGFLVVHEQKDKDNIKVVTLSASVQID